MFMRVIRDFGITQKYGETVYRVLLAAPIVPQQE